MTDQKTNLLQRITWLLVLLVACQLLFGCAESSFTLAEESRLPKWFKVPQGLSRADVKVTMDYYIPAVLLYLNYGTKKEIKSPESPENKKDTNLY